MIPVLCFDQHLTQTPTFFDPLADQACEGVVATAFDLRFFCQLFSDRWDLAGIGIDRVESTDLSQVITRQQWQFIHRRDAIRLLTFKTIPDRWCDHHIPAIATNVNLVFSYAIAYVVWSKRIEVMRPTSRRDLLQWRSRYATRLYPFHSFVAVCVNNGEVYAGNDCPVSLRVIGMPLIHLCLTRLYGLIVCPFHTRGLCPLRFQCIVWIERMTAAKVLRYYLCWRATRNDMEAKLPHFM